MITRMTRIRVLRPQILLIAVIMDGRAGWDGPRTAEAWVGRVPAEDGR